MIEREVPAGAPFPLGDVVRHFLASALLLVSLLLAGPAFAHASLLSVDPADGTVLAAPPQTLTLRFNEQVAPVALRLVAPDGRGIALSPDVEGTCVTMTAPIGLRNGTYALSWRVISADGHPVGGATTFSIGAPSTGGNPEERAAVDWPLRVGIWVTRVATYLGLFIGIGGVFFVRWFGAGDAGRRACRTVVIGALLALPVSVGFQGLDVVGQPLADLTSSEVWREGMASTFGLFVAVAFVGLVLALIAASRLALSRWMSLLAFLCVGLSLALTGHAATADPQWLTRPAVFIHASVVAFWVGALVPLSVLLRGPPENAVTPLRYFSAAIPPLLLLLLLAGGGLALVQLGTPDALLATDYGRVFIAKMVSVAALLGLAAFNRWGLTGIVLADAGTARMHLFRSIAIELGLVLVIFGIVALWRFTPPPRALLEAASQPVDIHLMTKEAMAELVVAPGHAGPVTIDIAVMDPNAEALAAQAVTVDFANKDKGIEPIERQAQVQPDGSWHIDGMTLPVAGTWQVEVDILVSDFKEIDLTDQIDIRP